jgi:hypothetical protein
MTGPVIVAARRATTGALMPGMKEVWKAVAEANTPKRRTDFM